MDNDVNTFLLKISNSLIKTDSRYLQVFFDCSRKKRKTAESIFKKYFMTCFLFDKRMYEVILKNIFKQKTEESSINRFRFVLLGEKRRNRQTTKLLFQIIFIQLYPFVFFRSFD